MPPAATVRPTIACRHRTTSEARRPLPRGCRPNFRHLAGRRRQRRRRGVGPCHSGLQSRDVSSGVPWQHFGEVVHYFRESRSSRRRGVGIQPVRPELVEGWLPGLPKWCGSTSSPRTGQTHHERDQAQHERRTCAPLTGRALATTYVRRSATRALPRRNDRAGGGDGRSLRR